jgi:hypothetical protein
VAAARDGGFDMSTTAESPHTTVLT